MTDYRPALLANLRHPALSSAERAELLSFYRMMGSGDKRFQLPGDIRRAYAQAARDAETHCLHISACRCSWVRPIRSANAFASRQSLGLRFILRAANDHAIESAECRKWKTESHFRAVVFNPNP